MRAEAVVVISDALQWRLTATRWQAIEELLAAVDAAVAADDLEALTVAITDLELAGPVRITRIGAAPAVPAPPQVRDRLNRLVNSLGGTPAANRGEPGRQPGEDDRDVS